jgi:hypothetical protein
METDLTKLVALLDLSKQEKITSPIGLLGFLVSQTNVIKAQLTGTFGLQKSEDISVLIAKAVVIRLQKDGIITPELAANVLVDIDITDAFLDLVIAAGKNFSTVPTSGCWRSFCSCLYPVTAVIPVAVVPPTEKVFTEVTLESDSKNQANPLVKE